MDIPLITEFRLAGINVGLLTSCTSSLIAIFVGWALPTMISNHDFDVMASAHPTLVENGARYQFSYRRSRQ